VRELNDVEWEDFMGLLRANCEPGLIKKTLNVGDKTLYNSIKSRLGKNFTFEEVRKIELVKFDLS
jgi:hypothetical protein